MSPTAHHTPDIERAAEYWDTHSVTDENSEPVAEPVALKKPLSSVFSVRLDRDDVAKLRSMARANGIGPTTMARRLLRRAINDYCQDADDSALITISASDLDMAIHALVESIAERYAQSDERP